MLFNQKLNVISFAIYCCPPPLPHSNHIFPYSVLSYCSNIFSVFLFYSFLPVDSCQSTPFHPFHMSKLFPPFFLSIFCKTFVLTFDFFFSMFVLFFQSRYSSQSLPIVHFRCQQFLFIFLLIVQISAPYSTTLSMIVAQNIFFVLFPMLCFHNTEFNADITFLIVTTLIFISICVSLFSCSSDPKHFFNTGIYKRQYNDNVAEGGNEGGSNWLDVEVLANVEHQIHVQVEEICFKDFGTVREATEENFQPNCKENGLILFHSLTAIAIKSGPICSVLYPSRSP